MAGGFLLCGYRERQRNGNATLHERSRDVSSPLHPRSQMPTEVLLSLSQARQMLAEMLGSRVDRAKWARYRQAAAIPSDKRFFDSYDMTKLAYVVARKTGGDTLVGASCALWEILKPIEDGDGYESRAGAAVQTELDRFKEMAIHG